MFHAALQRVSQFTRPVIIGSCAVSGKCKSAIGSFIVINNEGWILTVAHLIRYMQKQHEQTQLYREYRNRTLEMEGDLASAKKHKHNKITRLERPKADLTRHHTTWWGRDKAKLRDLSMMPASDLALARLEPFDASGINHYPVFKTAGPDYAPGRSLCKLGFPLQDIIPVYNEADNTLALPPNIAALAMFPLDGVFTRVLSTALPELDIKEAGLFIETSTPSMLGHSGGPIFDCAGTVWGLQSHVRHYPLGFNPPVPGQPRGKNSTVPQFMNLGIGAHAEPIRQFLEAHNIAHQRCN